MQTEPINYMLSHTVSYFKTHRNKCWHFSLIIGVTLMIWFAQGRLIRKSSEHILMGIATALLLATLGELEYYLIFALPCINTYSYR